MAAAESFDVGTGCDLQEVDNAVNQTLKEVGQRYDFRGLAVEVDFQRKENRIVLSAPDEYKLKSLLEVLESKLARRKVPLKNLRPGTIEHAALSSVRQEIELQQGLSTEIARAIVKLIKDRKFKKVQCAIQGDQVRISSASRDALQEVIQALKQEDFGVELTFGNYRNAP